MDGRSTDALLGSSRLGKTVGKYRLHAILGSGGMSVVYAATHRNGFAVAIKMLHAHLACDEAMCRWFRREGKLANIVNHPGAVRVHDDDITEDGVPYLVVERLCGEALRAIWERAGRKLTVQEVVVLAYDALDVLAAAHARGLVHRDVKPDNLYLTDDGALKLLDFGIAHPLPVVGSGESMATIRVAGTPAFMAPEQARGIDVRPETDIWGLGATMFALIAGEHVHAHAPPPDLLLWASTRPARSIRDVARDLPVPVATVMDRALAFEPNDRFATAAAMRSALAEAYRTSFGETLVEARDRVVAHLRSRLPGAPKVAAESAKLYSIATQPPPRSGLSELRGAVTRTQAYVEPPAKRSLLERLTRAALTVGAIAGAAGGLAIATRGFQRVVAPSTLRVAPPPAPSAPAGTSRSLYELAIRDWREGATDAARSAFRRAADEDPMLAGAHIRFAALSIIASEESRAHYQRAQDLRDRLSPEEAALLEGFEPAMALPPDLASAARRLAEMFTAQPEFLDLGLTSAHIWLAVNEPQNALRVADAVLLRKPELPTALAYRASALIFEGRTADARLEYDHCLRVAPSGTTCLQQLADLDGVEGHCLEMETLSRKLISLDPKSPHWFLRLAQATYARTGMTSSVVPLLDEVRSRQPASIAQVSSLELQFDIDILSGNFDQALRRLKEFADVVATSIDPTERVFAARRQIAIEEELGQRSKAIDTALRFRSQLDTLPTTHSYDYRILPLVALHQLDAIDAKTFAAERDAWMTSATDHHAGNPALNWVTAYASAASTPEEARSALAMLPDANPFEDPLHRDSESENAIGNVYLLVDDLETARAHLSRGASTCTAMTFPLWHTWANLKLGRVLARTGDRDGACDAFAIVIQRWGHDPRSQSGLAARREAASLGCDSKQETTNHQ